MDTTATTVGSDTLSVELQARFQKWLDARKPQEQKFLDAYSDAMRIPRDDDVKDTGAPKAVKSKLFVGSTRGKIRSARAKIKDSLFGSGKMPFDTTPSKEDLKAYADVVEEILTFQLKDMGFKRMLGGGVNALCTYGTSTIFGPFEHTKTHTTADLVPSAGGAMVLGEKKHEYRCPYFEHAPTMDVYPDPEVEDCQKGMGVFWSSWKQMHEIAALAGQDGYNTEAIAFAITQLSPNTTSEGSDRTIDQRANIYRFSKDGRVRLVRYIGLVRRDQLAAWVGQTAEATEPSDPSADQVQDAADVVEVIIIMAGGVVIKADESPYKGGKRPAWRCVYEEVEHEFFGIGIAENNDPHQRVVNASFRLYMEGKAFALLKTCSVDRSKFEVSEDFKLFPGKRYQMRPGLTPDERKTAIIWHDVNDVTDGWERVIELSERFSDDDTGITKYSQGTDSQHLNNTATGISMIMNASSLPMKEVIQNIDEMWIEPALESLIDWNLQNLDPETVRVLLGEKQAALWAQIKQLGKTSFMNWKATGSSTFMVKEILMQKLQGFLQLVMSSPELASKVDSRELLEQIWDSGEIGKESPVLSEEDMGGKGKLPPEVEQTLQQQEQMIQQLEQQLKSKETDSQLKMAKLQSDERIEMQRMTIADRDSLVRATMAHAQEELLSAQVDKTQADTAAALVAAQLAPQEHLLSVAEALNEAERTDAISKDQTS